MLLTRQVLIWIFLISMIQFKSSDWVCYFQFFITFILIPKIINVDANIYIYNSFYIKAIKVNQKQMKNNTDYQRLFEKICKIANQKVALSFCSTLNQNDFNMYYNLSEQDLKTIINDNNQQFNETMSPSSSQNKTELQNNNTSPEEYIKSIRNDLQRQFCPDEIEKILTQFLKFIKEYQTKKLLSLEQLKKRNKIKANNLVDQLLLVDSAFYYSTTEHHRLRTTQILAIYLFLMSKKPFRTILQILTGQGKSTIISCLAAILSKRNMPVDIITTNQMLARRDVMQKLNFYQLLNIKAFHNFAGISSEHIHPRQCYQGCSVVYGIAHSFQVDILYDQYKARGTRNKRDYVVAIIDEVDSMFVDDKGHQTLLGSTYVGFQQFIQAMKMVWQHVTRQQFYLDNQNEIRMIVQIKQKNQVLDGPADQILLKIAQQLREKFANEVIPEWRMSYVSQCMKSWVLNAIVAIFRMKQNVHYIVKDQQITPIDYQNTGSLQKNVQWQNGLHQFLQMKHGLTTTTQGLTSNFISNIGHFRRYDYIYGLTGTLGSRHSMLFLQKHYEAKMLSIPPYRKRRLQNFPGFLCYSNKEWSQKIIQRVDRQIKQNRSVLITCQSIMHVDIILECLEKQNKFKSIQTIKTGQQTLKSHIGTHQLIIATNLAGRGTDLKITPELQKSGGLHVIITFMPENKRVQMQARGRAGRNGAPGSSQIIVNYCKYSEQEGYQKIDLAMFNQSDFENTIDEFKQLTRDKQQEKKMENDTKIVQQLVLKDKLFYKYCQAIKKIPDFQKNRAKREAIQQKWALFLKTAQICEYILQKIQQESTKLINSFVENSQEHYNPNHGVMKGIHALNQGQKEKADKAFKQVSDKDTNLTCKISAKMLQVANAVNINPQSSQNVKKALSGLAGFDQMIQQRKDMLTALHIVNQGPSSKETEKFLLQRQENQRNQLRQAFDPSGIKLVNQNIEKQKFQQIGQNFKPIQQENKNQYERLTNIAQVKVLDHISDYVKSQLEKFNNLKDGEYIKFEYKPLTDIIDVVPGQQKQTKKAIQNLQNSSLEYVPQAIVVKKKKVPWWKRALVFCLGALQICIGALIAGASLGSASSFGVSMIVNGVEDCYKALFKPEQIADLRKYFSKRALGYTADLMLLGSKGIKQLSTAFGNGFKLFKQKGISQVMSLAVQTMKKGFTNIPQNIIQQITKRKIFQGMSSQKIPKIQQRQQMAQILKNPQLKKVVRDQIQEDIKLDQIKNNFQESAKKQIQIIAKNACKNCQHLQLTSGLNLKTIIKNAFAQNFQKKFDSKTQPFKSQEKKMYRFIILKYKQKNLGAQLVKELKIEDKLTETLKEIRQDKHGKAFFVKFWMQTISSQINKIIKIKRQSIQKKIENVNTLIQRIKTDRLTSQQRDQLVNEYNSKVNEVKFLRDRFQQETSSVTAQTLQQTINNLLNNNILSGSKIIIGPQTKRHLNKEKILIQQAVENLQKKELQNISDKKTLEQLVEQNIFTIFNKVAGNSIDAIISKASNCSKNMQIFEEKFKDEIKQVNKHDH